MDDANPMQWPICLTLAKSFVLRGSAAQLAATHERISEVVKDLEARLEENQKEHDDLLQQINAKKLEAATCAEEAEEARKSEEEFIQQYKKDIDEQFEAVEPYVQLIASMSSA